MGRRGQREAGRGGEGAEAGLRPAVAPVAQVPTAAPPLRLEGLGWLAQACEACEGWRHTHAVERCLTGLAASSPSRWPLEMCGAASSTRMRMVRCHRFVVRSTVWSTSLAAEEDFFSPGRPGRRAGRLESLTLMFRDTIVKSPSADRMAASSEWQLAGRPRNELPMVDCRAGWTTSNGRSRPQKARFGEERSRLARLGGKAFPRSFALKKRSN